MFRKKTSPFWNFPGHCRHLNCESGRTELLRTTGHPLQVEPWFSGPLRLLLSLRSPLSFRLTEALSRRSAHPPSARLPGALSLLAPVSGSGGSLKGCDGLAKAVSLRFQFGQNRVQCQVWLLSFASPDSRRTRLRQRPHPIEYPPADEYTSTRSQCHRVVLSVGSMDLTRKVGGSA